MAFETFLVENPGALAVGISIIIFAIAFEILFKAFKNRIVALVASLAISAITGWNLYKKEFYGWESVLAVVLIVVAIGIFVKVLMGFGERYKRIFAAA